MPVIPVPERFEAGASQIQSQPGLHSKILYQKKLKQKQKKTYLRNK
jgi:hypothetical protein